jgi:hypothetical protein
VVRANVRVSAMDTSSTEQTLDGFLGQLNTEAVNADRPMYQYDRAAFDALLHEHPWADKCVKFGLFCEFFL